MSPTRPLPCFSAVGPPGSQQLFFPYPEPIFPLGPSGSKGPIGKKGGKSVSNLFYSEQWMNSASQSYLCVSLAELRPPPQVLSELCGWKDASDGSAEEHSWAFGSLGRLCQ